MATLLKVVGGVWALLGFGNIIFMPGWTQGSAASGLLVFGLIFNFLVFVLPGLIVYGLGSRMTKRATAGEEGGSSKSQPIEARLQQLNDLKVRGLVNESEYADRRAEILREI